MAQTLLLGLGGTGSRIVNGVARTLNEKNISINDGQICCAVLDTNDNDNDKINESGVGIPVVGTSKQRIIDDYLKMYGNKGVEDWMPISPALRKESMSDGASQMRPKSRLAFMDTLEDRSIRRLEMHIEKLFDNRDGTKIRVMIVSSLAGGTGAGMFIQTALWLRKYFAKRRCTVTIRGIFVLPDVFINTIEDIRTDETEIQSLYANAYGAIRELNAITKIKTKGMKPLLPVKLDNLFDSDADASDGLPVYDYAFFIDDISEGGSVLTQIDHYEEVVSRLVYMQLYAPMHDDLYSEEDNLFKRFQKSKEPVFGSCGTAKAIYPASDILRYCSLRAAQDSISTGWRRLDDEIKEKQRKEEEREKNGVVISQRLNPRGEFVRLFDIKAAKTGDQVGKDRLFVNIGNDVKNEQMTQNGDGTMQVEFSDKVEDLVEKIELLVESTVDTTDPGSLSTIRVNKAWEDSTTDTRDSLKTFVDNKAKAVRRVLDDTDASVNAMAEEVLDSVLPSDMGSINQDNASSIYGFLTKKDNNNETYFVHPIAMRYLLYKLAARLDDIKMSVDLDGPNGLRISAEKGHGCGKQPVDFDNKKTGTVETSPTEYLKSKHLFQNEEKFLKEFKNLYAQHNKGQAELCRSYAVAALKVRVAILISQRLEKLISEVEGFFKALPKVTDALEEHIEENVRKNSTVAQKVIYVCASGEEKEELYQSLGFSTDTSDVKINAIIARALYGQFCAHESPDAQNNAEYKGKNIVKLFSKEVVSAYSKLILAKNKDDIDLDIYTAICKSADMAYEKKKAKDDADSEDDYEIDFETEDSGDDKTKHKRHIEAMQAIKKKLFDLGAPFLISNDDLPENDEDDEYDEDFVFTPTKKIKTFWGFHPAVANSCPELAQILGVNVKLQQNSAYAKNELDCYRAVYGIQAGNVEKFDELSNGAYYRSYRQIVRDMIAGEGEGHPEELIHTPHLDKTWHLFLPYITPEKQIEEDSKFFRLFWLALAYGMISINSKGKFEIARTVQTATGSYQKNESIIWNDEPVSKVNVSGLLAALKLDGSFMIDAGRLEAKFREECEKLNYEGTEFLRGKSIKEGDSKVAVGGLGSKLDNNAVSVIVRYYHTPHSDDDTTAMLIQSLEKLCRELVAGNYEANEQKKIEYRGYEICKRIYTASTMKDKDIELIRHWKEAWSRSSAED